MIALPVVFALGAASCDRTGRPDFALVAVEPNVVSADQPTQVLLRGAFPVLASTDLDESDPPVIDAGWRVEIADATLDGNAVSQRDRSTLEVDTPAGLPTGTHDVTVVSPRGDERTLSAGLAVEDGPTIDGSPGL